MKPEIKTELENFLNWLESKVDFIAWSKQKNVGFDILQEYGIFRKKNVKLKHYVNCYFPGILFSETSEKELTDEFELPKGCFMYEFYDKDGDVILNKSNRHYIGDVLTYEDIEKLNIDGTYDITLSNMRSNNYPKVIKSIYGNIYPYEEGCIVIPSAVYFREQKLKRILNGE